MEFGKVIELQLFGIYFGRRIQISMYELYEECEWQVDTTRPAECCRVQHVNIDETHFPTIFIRSENINNSFYKYFQENLHEMLFFIRRYWTNKPIFKLVHSGIF